MAFDASQKDAPAAQFPSHAVVEELPKFDLEPYIANYRGRTRFDRLLLVGVCSAHLHTEALGSALATARCGKDVQQYELVLAAIKQLRISDIDATPDSRWIEDTKKKVKAETDKLDAELKGYRNNLIKESIRMGYTELGSHYHQIGDLANSQKSYSRMRDFCTTGPQIVDMSMRLINVSFDQRNWLAVQSNVQRVRAKYEEAEKQSAKLSAAMGISMLSIGNYADATLEFLETNPRMATAKMDDPNDEESYNEICTPNDIAVYGGLCALATLSRTELQSRVLEHKTFRNYLELEPHIRRAISHFINAKYSTCLKILDDYKGDYLLDIYLQPHLSKLYSVIRSKAMVQYFIPFSRVTFETMATAFNTSEEAIIPELERLIKLDLLDARLDLVHKLLIEPAHDLRADTISHAIEISKDYEQSLHQRLLRINIMRAGLQVTPLTQVKGNSDAGMELDLSKSNNISIASSLSKEDMGSVRTETAEMLIGLKRGSMHKE